MKLSALSFPLVAAALVSATPLRVVLVSSSGQQHTPNLRFGHAMGGQGSAALVGAVPVPQTEPHLNHPQRYGCSRFHQKAVEFSNIFRQALGMPVIETQFKSSDGHIHGGAVRIMPFVGTPPVPVEIHTTNGTTKGGDKVQVVRPTWVHHHHGHHHFHHRLQNESFLKRIHVALMTLGPWEGRAIAFVLGCGLGVLLRMVWVLVVVSYRAIKGDKEDEDEYTLVPNQYDAEEIFVAPPQYFIDEKAPIVEN